MLKKVLITAFLIIISFDSMAFADTNHWYYPEWVDKSKYNSKITVLDTDSALGRYSNETKEIGLKDIIKYHGHLCDGMVIAYVELKAVLSLLFPYGKVDRTDLRVVSKNGPCWVDTVNFMTGARINFETLSIDNSIGDGFIVQKISTVEAYDVHLKPAVFPQEMAELEKKIKQTHLNKENVNPEDIDKLETMANSLIKKLLNTSPKELLDIKKLETYNYKFDFTPGIRTDIINKDVLKN